MDLPCFRGTSGAWWHRSESAEGAEAFSCSLFRWTPGFGHFRPVSGVVRWGGMPTMPPRTPKAAMYGGFRSTPDPSAEESEWGSLEHYRTTNSRPPSHDWPASSKSRRRPPASLGSVTPSAGARARSPRRSSPRSRQLRSRCGPGTSIEPWRRYSAARSDAARSRLPSPGILASNEPVGTAMSCAEIGVQRH